MLGPPWPESIKSATGELPEYVTEQGGEWVPFTGQKEENHPADYVSHWRARVDLVLIVDGQIVDTNRIQFPAGTTVIDKRSRK
jgi:phage gp37-like protein